MKMHNPPHPGEILRELCIEPRPTRESVAALRGAVTYS